MKNFVKIYSIAFFVLLFLIGLLSYQDYGVTGDEPIHRWIGSIYYNYIILQLHKRLDIKF